MANFDSKRFFTQLRSNAVESLITKHETSLGKYLNSELRRSVVNGNRLVAQKTAVVEVFAASRQVEPFFISVS